jgi:Dockerin type I domain
LRYITNIAGSTIDLNAPVGVHDAGDPVAQVSFAQSLRDLNNDGFVDISDVPLLTAVLGSQGGNPGNDGVGDTGVPGYQGRYDFNNDGFVDISDVIALVGIFGASCGPS